MKSISPPLAPEAPPAARAVPASALQALRVGALGALAGWPVLAGRAIFYLITLVVLTALWSKVAAERLPGALRLPPGGLSLYIGVTEWIVLSVPSIHLRLEDDVRAGALDVHLLRPKPHLVLRLAEAGGDMLARLGVLGLTGLAVVALSGRAAPAEGLALAAASALLGGVVGLLVYALAGLAAFWVRRTLPAFLVIQKLLFLMGGLFAPVSLYPPLLRRLCEASPFAAQLYWPAAQLLARSPAAFARTLALQAAWIAILGLAAAGLWRAGVRRVMRGDV